MALENLLRPGDERSPYLFIGSNEEKAVNDGNDIYLLARDDGDDIYLLARDDVDDDKETVDDESQVDWFDDVPSSNVGVFDDIFGETVVSHMDGSSDDDDDYDGFDFLDDITRNGYKPGKRDEQAYIDATYSSRGLSGDDFFSVDKEIRCKILDSRYPLYELSLYNGQSGVRKVDSQFITEVCNDRELKAMYKEDRLVDVSDVKPNETRKERNRRQVLGGEKGKAARNNMLAKRTEKKKKQRRAEKNKAKERDMARREQKRVDQVEAQLFSFESAFEHSKKARKRNALSEEEKEAIRRQHNKRKANPQAEARRRRRRDKAFKKLQRKKEPLDPNRDNARNRRRQRRAQEKAQKKLNKVELEEKKDIPVTESDFIFDLKIEDMLDELPDRFIDLFADFGVFLYSTIRGRDFMDHVITVYTFMRSNCDLHIRDIVKHIGNLVEESYDYLYSFIRRNDLPVTESFDDGINFLQSMMSVVINSQVFKVLRELVLAAVSLKFFSKNLTKTITKYIGKPNKNATFYEMFTSVLHGIKVLYRVGGNILKGESITDLLLAADPVEYIRRKCLRLVAESRHVYYGLPIDGHVSAREHEMECLEASKELDSVMKEISPSDTRREVLVTVRDELIQIITNYARAHARETRIPPIAILLHGPPGIGKSRMLTHFYKMWSDMKKREFDVSQVYTRTEGSEYWEGYDPLSHPIIHYTEVANKSLSQVRSRGDDNMTELQRLIDSAPMPLNMANVDKKGTVWARPEFVVADTNNPGLHVRELMHSPAALLRRFIFVGVSVLPEFRQEGSTAIDSAKSRDAGGDLLDRYHWIITTYAPKGDKGVKPIILYNGSDLYEFEDVLRQTCAERVNEQDRAICEEKFEEYKQPSPLVPYYGDKFTFVRGSDRIGILNLCSDSQSVLDFLDCTGYRAEVYTERTRARYILTEGQLGSIDADCARLTGFNDVTDVINLHDDFDCSDEWNELNVLHPDDFLVGAESLLEDIRADWKQWTIRRFHHLRYVTARGAFLFFTALLTVATAIGEWFLGASEAAQMLTVVLLVCMLLYDEVLRFLISLIFGIVWVHRAYFFKKFAVHYTLEFAIGQCDLAWRRLNYAIGRTQNIFAQHDARFKKVFMFVGAAMVPIGLFRLYRRFANKPKTQAHTSFRMSTPIDADLNQIEERLASGYGRKVVHNSIVPKISQWNLAHRVLPVAAHPGPPEQVYDYVKNNIVSVRIDTSSGQRWTHALGVKSGYVLINGHAIGDHMKFTCVVDKSLSREESSYQILHRTRADLQQVSGDVWLLNLGDRMYKDICKHVLDGFIDGPTTGYYFHGPTRIDHVGALNVNDVYMGSFSLHNAVNYQGEHAAGLCGTPVIAQVGKKSALIGIHTAGYRSDQCFAECFSLGQLKKAIMSLEEREKQVLLPVYSEAELPLLEEPIRKSPFRHMSLPHIHYYGKEPGVVIMKDTSDIVESNMSPILPDLFREVFSFEPSEQYGKPIMKPFMRDGVYYSPANTNLKKLNCSPPTLDKEVLGYVIKTLTAHWIAALESRGVTHLSPLTFEQTINGVVSNPYLRRMNASTSGGHFYTGNKGVYLPLVEEEPLVIREMVPQLRADVLEIFDAYEEERCAGFIYDSHKKEEARPMSKILVASTRYFRGIPLPGYTVARMLLAPIYSLTIEFPDVFYCALGRNMHKEAHLVFGPLEEFGSKWIEFDYSGYDVTVVLDVARAANTVVYNLAEHFGYNEYALSMLQGILSDFANPILCMDKDIFCRPGMQPSGKYGTAEDNSIRNVILMMYAWYTIPELEDLFFFDYVKPCVLGDDVVGTVKDEVIDYFNNIVYAEKCMELYHMTVTPAAKGEQLVPWLSADEVSFLKRKFTRHQNGRMIAPLDMGSIYKTLQWRLPSTSISLEEQEAMTCISVLYEIFFHSNEHQYEKFREGLAQYMYNEYKTTEEYVDAKFPSYYEMYENMFPSGIQSEATWAGGLSMPLARGEREGCIALLVSLMPSIISRQNLTPITIWQFKSADQISNWLSEEKFDGSPHPVSGTELLLHYNSLLEVAYEALLYLYPDPDQWEDIAYELVHNLDYGAELSRSERRIRKQLFVSYYDMKATCQTLQRKKKQSRGLWSESEHVELRLGVPEQGDQRVENFGDMFGMDANEIKYEESSYPIQGQDEELSIGDFFRRPVEIASFDIDVGSDVSLEYEVWDLWSLNPSVRAKLRNFAYFAGDLHITIIVSGTPFHYGKILVSYQPYAVRNANIEAYEQQLLLPGDVARPAFLNYLSQSPTSVTLDVTTNQPLLMQCPFISTKPMHRLFNSSTAVISDVTSYADLETAGRLYFYSIRPLATEGESAISVSCQIYAHVEGIRLGTTTATQVQITTESDEHDTGPVEMLASHAAAVSACLSNYPPLAPLAKASEAVFKGIGLFAAHFGFSEPNLVDDPVWVKNRPWANGAQTLGYSTVSKISLDPRQELTIDPRLTGSSLDEMLIERIANIESYLTTFDWSSSDSLMITSLFKCRVTPRLDTFYEDVANRWYQPTAMSFAVMPFYYWRGDIRFRFEIVGSAYHRGKLGIYFEPNIAQASIIDVDPALNKNFFQIIDIKDTRSVSYCVKWAFPRAWAEVSSLDAGINQYGDFFSATVEAYQHVNGYINVVPFTELTSPKGGDISVNVYVSCENLRVNQLVDENMPDERIIWTESEDDKNDMESICFELNHSSARTNNISLLHFGEEPFSFRALLKRYVTIDDASITAGMAGEAHRVARLLYAVPAPAYGDSSVSHKSVYGYLRYAYLGMKGGMRFRYRANYGQDAFDGLNSVTVSIHPPVITFVEANAYSAAAVTATEYGSVSFVPNTNGGLEFEMPLYTNNLFVFSYADDNIGTNATSDQNTTWSKGWVLRAHPTDATYTDGKFMIDAAVAEDFTFLRYSGAPFYSITF